MDPQRRQLYLRIYTVFAVITTLALLLYAIPEWQKCWKIYPWDGKVDWIVARAWFAGTNPYSPEALHAVKLDGLGHPPSTAFYMLPFARFEMQDMSPMLGQLILGLFLVALILTARELSLPAPLASAFLLFAGVTSTKFMHYHLYLAQISALIGCMLVFAWLALRRGHEYLAGAFLGFACALKFYPGLLVLSLLLGRRIRAVAAACATWLVIASIMTWRFGIVSWLQYFKSEEIIARMWIGHLHNASLYAVLLRALHPACRGKAWPDPIVSVAAPIIGLALFALAWWIGRRAWRKLVDVDLAYAAMVVLGTFLNPFTFEHYFSLEVVPWLIAVRELWRAHERGLERRWTIVLGVGLLAAAVMPSVDIWLKDIALRNLPRTHFQLHLLEVINWLHLPLLFTILVALLRRRERDPERAAASDERRAAMADTLAAT